MKIMMLVGPEAHQTQFVRVNDLIKPEKIGLNKEARAWATTHTSFYLWSVCRRYDQDLFTIIFIQIFSSPLCVNCCVTYCAQL